MWEQTDVNKVLTMANVTLMALDLTRSPLEKMIHEDAMLVKETRLRGVMRHE